MIETIWIAVVTLVVVAILFYKPRYRCSDLVKSVDDLNKEDKR